MYHRIIPPNKTIQAGMYVKPETFDNHLTYLKKHFNVVPLNFLIENGRDNIIRNNKPLCVLTFDDGWRDFYDYAYPLLKKHQCPAAVFLPTKFINSKKQFWTDTFAHLLLHQQPTVIENLSDLEIRADIEYLNGLSGTYDNRLESGIHYLKKYPSDIVEKILYGLSEVWQVDLDKSERDFLNWTEIEEMKMSGIVSFGSHTVNHQILTTVDDETVERELVESREELLRRNLADTSDISFCYPNGNYTKEIADMVCSSGYHLAVTTKNGWNHADADKFTLKRVGIHEDMTSTDALFACRIAGLI